MANKKIMIISIIIVSLFIGAYSLYIYAELQELERDLEICDELGYDGIRDVGPFRSGRDCFNFTELEKARRGKK